MEAFDPYWQDRPSGHWSKVSHGWAHPVAASSRSRSPAVCCRSSTQQWICATRECSCDWSCFDWLVMPCWSIVEFWECFASFCGRLAHLDGLAPHHGSRGWFLHLGRFDLFCFLRSGISCRWAALASTVSTGFQPTSWNLWEIAHMTAMASCQASPYLKSELDGGPHSNHSDSNSPNNRPSHSSS